MRAINRALSFAVLLALVGCGNNSTSGPAIPNAPHAPVNRHHPLHLRAAYHYDGICIYCVNGAADPLVNADVSTLPTDPNSASVIAGMSGMTFASSSDAILLRANIANVNTPCVVVGYNQNGGHNPPITPGIHGGGAGACFPWQSGFVMEGTVTSNCSGDCHVIVLSTKTGMMYQGGGFDYSPLIAYDGAIDLASDSYHNQWGNKGDNCQVAGVCFLGFADLGEDFIRALNGTQITHPLSLIIPTKNLISGFSGVNYSHGVGNGAGTCSGAANCLELGDVLALNTGTYPSCNMSDLIVSAYVKQAQLSGWVVTDTESNGQPAQTRLGLDRNGNDDSDAALFACQSSWTPADFHLVQRGSLVP